MATKPAARMSEPETGRCYDIWAGIYDRTFGALVHNRQIRALQELRPKPGDRVLDIGVGTGTTLLHYPDNITVFGMDLSGGMLGKAREKLQQKKLTHCRLVQADAMLPPFADGSFDHIVISHTISVVSEPSVLATWARRLLKPGGRIIILNHFRSPHPLIGRIERWVNPLCVKIGWRSDLSLEDCLQGSDLHVQYRFKMRLLDFWQIVVLTSDQPPQADSPARSRPTSASQDSQTAHDHGHPSPA